VSSFWETVKDLLSGRKEDLGAVFVMGSAQELEKQEPPASGGLVGCVVNFKWHNGRIADFAAAAQNRDIMKGDNHFIRRLVEIQLPQPRKTNSFVVCKLDDSIPLVCYFHLLPVDDFHKILQDLAANGLKWEEGSTLDEVYAAVNNEAKVQKKYIRCYIDKRSMLAMLPKRNTDVLLSSVRFIITGTVKIKTSTMSRMTKPAPARKHAPRAKEEGLPSAKSWGAIMQEAFMAGVVPQPKKFDEVAEQFQALVNWGKTASGIKNRARKMIIQQISQRRQIQLDEGLTATDMDDLRPLVAQLESTLKGPDDAMNKSPCVQLMKRMNMWGRWCCNSLIKDFETWDNLVGGYAPLIGKREEVSWDITVEDLRDNFRTLARAEGRSGSPFPAGLSDDDCMHVFSLIFDYIEFGGGLDTAHTFLNVCTDGRFRTWVDAWNYKIIKLLMQSDGDADIYIWNVICNLAGSRRRCGSSDSDSFAFCGALLKEFRDKNQDSLRSVLVPRSEARPGSDDDEPEAAGADNEGGVRDLRRVVTGSSEVVAFARHFCDAPRIRRPTSFFDAGAPLQTGMKGAAARVDQSESESAESSGAESSDSD
jgi:hypothetical protein